MRARPPLHPDKQYGYLKLSRKTFHHDTGDPLWLERRPRTRWEAWMDLLQLAAHAAHARTSQGHTITIPRGHLLASVRYLAGRWQWGHGRVLRFMAWLASDERVITANETPIGTLYRVVNYELYQTGGTPNGTPNGTATEQQRNEENKGERTRVLALRDIEDADAAPPSPPPAALRPEDPRGAPGNRAWLAPFLDLLHERGVVPDEREVGKMRQLAKRLIDEHGFNVALKAFDGFLADWKGETVPGFHYFAQNFARLKAKWAVRTTRMHEVYGADDPRSWEPIPPEWPEGWKRRGEPGGQAA